MNERQKMLLLLALDVLNYANGYDSINGEFKEELKYDEAEQDIGCLEDDIRIEFGL